MCESIGHRPLRGRCPKTKQPYISDLHTKRNYRFKINSEENESDFIDLFDHSHLLGVNRRNR